jgi:hypothetical protein
MMALYFNTKAPARVTISLNINTSEGASSTGPILRTLTIPKDGSVLIGRASTSPSKDRKPSADNALFTCAVMSRSHATISAPSGPHVCLSFILSSSPFLSHAHSLFLFALLHTHMLLFSSPPIDTH